MAQNLDPIRIHDSYKWPLYRCALKYSMLVEYGCLLTFGLYIVRIIPSLLIIVKVFEGES